MPYIHDDNERKKCPIDHGFKFISSMRYVTSCPDCAKVDPRIATIPAEKEFGRFNEAQASAWFHRTAYKHRKVKITSYAIWSDGHEHTQEVTKF